METFVFGAGIPLNFKSIHITICGAIVSDKTNFNILLDKMQRYKCKGAGVRYLCGLFAKNQFIYITGRKILFLLL